MRNIVGRFICYFAAAYCTSIAGTCYTVILLNQQGIHVNVNHRNPWIGFVFGIVLGAFSLLLARYVAADES